MTIEIRKTWILTLGLALGVTACDQPGASGCEDDGLQTGSVDNGRRKTLNTNAWIPASARDLHEFRDNGDVFVNGYDYASEFKSVSHPSTPYGALETPVQGPSDGPSIKLHPDGEFTFEVRGPQGSGSESILEGADLVGLTMHFDMRDGADNAYGVGLEIIGHATDDAGNDLYEFVRVDPSTGRQVALCEQSQDYGRFARVTNRLHIEGETGDIDIQAPSLRHIGCLASVPAKAMLLGYEPTEEQYPQFVLASRVVRADYCADNQPYTFPGNLFSVEDNLDGPKTIAAVEASLSSDDVLEAVWGEQGVLCVGSPRAFNTVREDIVCPTKRFADGTVIHNWQPPSCADFEDTGAADQLRMYSVTSAPSNR